MALGITSKCIRLAVLGFLVHEIGQALGRGIGTASHQSIYAVAGGLGDLLAVLVQEQLVGEMLRRAVRPDIFADAVIDRLCW